jgi:signal recognition particle receptor subunit beta
MHPGSSDPKLKAGETVPVFNYAKKEVNLKIVYYGPGLSGKTTNLQAIHDGIKPEFKGKLVSLATQTDRTLFFDFMPLELGSLGGFQVRLHLYTVPGQVHYNATRKLVLKGVDGVVFVADSQRAMKDANIESFMNLEKNLQSYGKALKAIPHVIQANKRDLDDIIPMEEIDTLINRHSVMLTEAVASEGDGVLETLTEIVRIVMKNLKDSFAVHRGEGRDGEEAEPTSKEPLETGIQPDVESETEMAPESEPLQEFESEPVLEMELDAPVPDLTADLEVDDTQPEVDSISLDGEPDEVLYPEEEIQTAETTPVIGGMETAEPFRVTVPVDGVGTVELAITIRARILPGTEEQALAADVEVNGIHRDKGSEPVFTGEQEQAAPSLNTENDRKDQHVKQGPKTGQVHEEENLPPLTDMTGEPLGAPLDGQTDDLGELEVLPASDGEAKRGSDDKQSAEDVSVSAEPEQEYDPTTDRVDLFEGEKSRPEAPESRKKGVLGIFKKK